MGVEISGLDEFEKMLADAEKRQRGAVNTFLKMEAEELLGAARDKTPVDTGALRESWERSCPNNGMISVHNNSEYAAHVEYGHRIPIMKNGDFVRDENGNKKYKEKTVPGVKMLRKSVLEQKEDFKSRAQDILKEMFK